MNGPLPLEGKCMGFQVRRGEGEITTTSIHRCDSLQKKRVLIASSPKTRTGSGRCCRHHLDWRVVFVYARPAICWHEGQLGSSGIAPLLNASKSFSRFSKP